jgi:hypothetical protein
LIFSAKRVVSLPRIGTPPALKTLRRENRANCRRAEERLDNRFDRRLMVLRPVGAGAERLENGS